MKDVEIKANAKEIKIKAKIHKNLKYIEIDGKTYVKDSAKLKNKRSKQKETAEITFKQFNIKEYEKLVDNAAEKISKKANVKEIIRQALFDLPVHELLEVKEELEKAKPKIRNNVGCVSMNVGKVNIPIRE